MSTTRKIKFLFRGILHKLRSMVFAVKLIVVIRSRVLLSRQIFKFYTQFFLFEYFKFKKKNFHAIKIFETFFFDMHRVVTLNRPFPLNKRMEKYFYSKLSEKRFPCNDFSLLLFSTVSCSPTFHLVHNAVR